MIAKIVRIAASAPSDQTLPTSNCPIVEKSGTKLASDGKVVKPTRKLMIDMIRMLISSAAWTLSTNSVIVIPRPSSDSQASALFGNTNATGVPAPATMRPASLNPMNRMKRPIPTPIARFSASGTAFMIASRRPTRTSTRTTRPSRTMTPIAPAGVRPSPRTSVKATMPLMPRPAASAIG